ncbi:hypothetical protein HIM_07801 [Hirsutella minnesotensis 3608]|uniref:Synaptobrevin n=1 Tax=Hirsutella minnesotensis 3608 TaxID=1043627 RepID=A0A0F7ZYQ0_9HYPO|nr:hypothetical protein HIM_07801 [Hirsutella minnesotensis 3608]
MSLAAPQSTCALRCQRNHLLASPDSVTIIDNDMALMTQGILAAQSPGKSQDVEFVQLSQLVSRLHSNVLHPTPDRERRLRTSEYERARVEANIQNALSLLQKLEQDATRIKAPAQRHERQEALHARRDTLDTLLDRLQDLRHIAMDEEEDTSDEEDLLGEIVPTPSESAPSIAAEAQQDDERPEEAPEEVLPDPPPPPQPVSQRPVTPTPVKDDQISPKTPIFPLNPPTQIMQDLRGRRANSVAPPLSPDASYSTARASLFGGRAKSTTAQTSTATAEAILDQQRAEQDALSSSILQMAGALKASSQRFSSTLEADKEVLGRAGEGIDKTEQSMDAARGRMGALRRMTEGKGWWGRMILFAWVYGLMLGLVLLVFVMPKLRF